MTDTDLPHRYPDDQRDAIYRAMRERRDMRHFNGRPLATDVLERLVGAAHLAPSVGYMQPWRFIRITDAALRADIFALVERERLRTAATLSSRQAEFLSLKIEGIRECSELLVTVLMPDTGAHVIGRRTLPEMDLAAAACAIQNLWLAARAEGVGMGWVSFFDPDELAQRLALPAGARPIAVLCLGDVEAFYPRPMFEDAGFGERLPLDSVLFENAWPADAQPTPAAY